MKKKILVLIALVLCLSLVGCGKKEEKEVPKEMELVAKKLHSNIPDDIMNKYNAGISNYEVKLEALLYLGSQVVEGTNYMFLTKSEDNKYKVVIIYENLEGVVTVSKVTDFDLTKYNKESISGTQSQLLGGWIVNSTVLEKNPEEETIIGYVSEAVQYYAGVNYVPLYVLGEKDNYYSLLALEKVLSEEPNYSMKVITISKSEKESKVEYNSFLNLEEFN